ncbi:hypothetical protein V2A60_001821 [Cordyceps javanica]
MLLQAGANPRLLTENRGPFSSGPQEMTGSSAFKLACMHGSLDALKALMPVVTTSEDINQAICWAAEYASSPLVEFLASQPLLQINARVNGMTPLMHASNGRYPDCVQRVLAAGADATLGSTSTIDPAHLGRTAVHWWAANWAPRKPCVDHEDDSGDAEESFRLLFEAGAAINARDAAGNTPLHCAVDVRAARILLEAGANVHATNNAGMSVLHASNSSRGASILHKNSAVLFEDIANAIDGGEKATDADKKKAIVGCLSAGGAVGVTPNLEKPIYSSGKYKADKLTPEGILIKVVSNAQ